MELINKENLFAGDCIRTFSGIYVNVFEPTIDMINIQDIAHALSNQCRFGGHLPNFYSVAEHSALCSKVVRAENRIAAILHDASEAYLLDIPSPIKKKITNYLEIEHKLMLLIAEKYGFKYPLCDDVKQADALMLSVEWYTLMLNQRSDFKYKLECFEPKKAKNEFLYQCSLLNILK